MGIVYIDQLVVMASIGIYPWEKRCLQKIIFDLQLSYIDDCFKNDINLYSYLDYTRVNQIILNLLNKRHFYLIENIADITANTLIEKFPSLLWVRIKVSKPNAIRNARNVGIYIKRKNLCIKKKIDIYIE